MDHIAAELGVDRRELRLRNLVRSGDTYPNGQELPDAAFEEAFERLEQVAPWAEASDERPYHGVGLAAVAWLTNPQPGSATLKLNEDGTVGVITGATEIGTGAVAAGVVQVVAEELGVQPEDVVVLPPDTDAATFDAGAQGSRTLFHAGNAVRIAAEEVRAKVFETASRMMEAAAADLELAEGAVRVVGAPDRATLLADVAQEALWSTGPIVGSGTYVSPPIPYDEGCMVGAMFTSFNAVTFHVHFAEVQVDPETGKVEVLRYVVVQDVGRAINPSAIEGQVHGGVAQGIGYALYEQLDTADGVYVQQDLEAYRLPTALDVPPIEIVLLEHPAPHGPFGAKGVAEPPVVPVAAAVGNAVSAAIGRPLNRLPITPADVLAALRNAPR
jgi:CO/xanthine dehydrogenase Mo-binding subunit